jgi:uncharacterized protein
MGKYVICKATNGQFYFNLKASNNEIILTSATYITKDEAKNGIQQVRNNAPYDNLYKKITTSKVRYFFILKAANGDPIGKSEMYKTKRGRDNGVKSVKENALSQTVEDLA